jgi:hypothetical protein
MAKPIISDLALRTRFSVSNKNMANGAEKYGKRKRFENLSRINMIWPQKGTKSTKIKYCS